MQTPSNSKHSKEPSWRDSIFGKKLITNLPDQFFERIWAYEIKLKQKFNMQILQQLIKYYSIAIEYYESHDDPKYKHYSQSLNLLWIQPQVMSHLNGSAVQKEKKEKFKKLLEQNKKENHHNEKMKNIWDNPQKEKSVSGWITKELGNQEDNFKKRMEAKKKKIALSTSDITEAVELMKNKQYIESPKNMNKSMDLNPDNADDIKDDWTNNIFTGNIWDELGENNLDFDMINNGDKGKSGCVPSEIKWNSVDGTSKDKFKELLDFKITWYTSEYSEYFNEKIIDEIIKKSTHTFDNYEKEGVNNAVNYANQIKEMEWMWTSNDDEMYKNQIGKVIYQWEEEEKIETDKIKNKYLNTNNEWEREYLQGKPPSNAGINVIDERLKVDMCTILSSFVLK